MATAASSFPGHDLVRAGLEDLAAGRETEAALVVATAARLRALGMELPAGGGPSPSHRLYVGTPRLTQAGHLPAEPRPAATELGVAGGV
jgi:hypothetical protein